MAWSAVVRFSCWGGGALAPRWSDILAAVTMIINNNPIVSTRIWRFHPLMSLPPSKPTEKQRGFPTLTD
jgi:hypothetical protein